MGGQGGLVNQRSWTSLQPSLQEWILDAVHSMGFQQTTPVQASAIPLFMQHKDVVVEAVTGSGKTLAFLVPILEKISRLEERIKKHHVAAIVISPTRELATQIYSVLLSLLAFHKQSAAALYLQEGEEDPDQSISVDTRCPIIVPQLLIGGNTSPTEDLTKFHSNSPNILVATPGRLLELLSSPRVHCPQSTFEILVLDEADRLLDMGFKDDLQKILARLPKQRRTGLFSASVSEAVDQIVRVGLRNPVKISVRVKGLKGAEDQRTPSSLQMRYIVASASQKWPALGQILTHLPLRPNKTIVYLSTCAAVDYFQHVLPSVLPQEQPPYKLIPLHGKHPPKVRQKNFGLFSDSFDPAILLTTDVAARGLDIPQVDLVIQIDPPSDPKVFLHRCGRAGRAGRKGLSIVMLQPGREEDYISFLELRKTPVTPLVLAAVTMTDDESSEVSGAFRQTMLTDRAIHDKAQRGFVSWVKSYSKHQASSIFRLSDVDWEDLGKAWGLLKLPKMPELRKWDGDRSLGVDIDWPTYKYQDKKREDARQRELTETLDPSTKAQEPDRDAEKKRSRTSAWSENLNRQEEREVKRNKRRVKREHERLEKMDPIQKQEREEVKAMIDQVRRRQKDEDGLDGDGFEGFDD